jgi:ribosomal protein S18 acetylase RimI-like enzyme
MTQEATMPNETTTTTMRVRPVAPNEFFAWHAVYTGYGEFYDKPLHDEKAVLVWSWIIDDAIDLECLVAVDDDDRVVGLAHFRSFVRPLDGSRGLHLDDLFVLPENRKQGVATSLIDGVSDVGRRRGASIVRWITASDNEAARALYDQVAEKTPWVTYDRTL